MSKPIPKRPKNSGRAPSMQWYPADWRKDTSVQMLSFHDRGVWFELINIMHESAERGVLVVNGSPMPLDALARLLGLDNQMFNQTLSNLLSYGVAKRRELDGAIYSKRMVEDEKLSQVRRNAGKLGGNPDLLNQSSNQTPTTRVNQNPTPSSSTSTSSSEGGIKTTAPNSCSLEEAKAYAQSVMLAVTPEGVDLWHATRVRDAWMISRNNGETPVRDWRADLRSSCVWIRGALAKADAAERRAGPSQSKSFAQQDAERKQAERHGSETITPKLL